MRMSLYKWNKAFQFLSICSPSPDEEGIEEGGIADLL